MPAIASKKPSRDDETAIDPAATERAAASVGKASSLPPPAVVAPDVDDEAETVYVPPDAPIPERPKTAALTGSVRLPESLPRESGVLGDMAYLWRVLRRAPAARRELAELDDKIVTEREGRAQRLLEVARNALADADLDTTLVGRAREHLVTLEEMRSQHAGAVAAADEEVAAIERELEEGKDERAERRDELRRERESIQDSLEPLRKRHGQARKRFAAVKKTLDKLSAQLTAAEAKLLEAESGADARACEAQIAGLSAEREAVASEEPEIAAELDELEPKIASLESSLAEIEETMAKLAKEDEKAERRAADKIAAVRARQTVDEGVATDLASERQEALLALGESLSDQRPDQFAWRLRAIEEHDLAIATFQRRAVELRELLANIEIWPLLRGTLYTLLVAGAVAAALIFATSR